MTRSELTRQPDVLDQAADLASRLSEAAVDHARHRAKPEQVQNPDGSWPQTECEDCGEDIEEARLLMGKIRCIACQRTREHRIRLGLAL